MRHRLSDGSGFLEIDHSNSPGLTEADVAHLPEPMRKRMLIVREGKVEARDVQQCSHCQRAVVLNPLKTDADRDVCLKCHHYVCRSCAVAMAKAGGACVPFQQVLDTAATLAEKFVGQPDHPDAVGIDVQAMTAERAPRIVLTDAP